jgi:hypothetical protein
VNSDRTIFAQLMDFVAPYESRVCVDRYGGHDKVQTFSCWDQSSVWPSPTSPSGSACGTTTPASESPGPFVVELAATVYAFESTTNDLCLALFRWALRGYSLFAPQKRSQRSQEDTGRSRKAGATEGQRRCSRAG